MDPWGPLCGLEALLAGEGRALLLAGHLVSADVPLSVGLMEPQAPPSQLNTVEFHWDPAKRTSLFLRVSLKLQVTCRWQQPWWEGTVSFSGGERTRRRNHFQKTP